MTLKTSALMARDLATALEETAVSWKDKVSPHETLPRSVMLDAIGKLLAAAIRDAKDCVEFAAMIKFVAERTNNTLNTVGCQYILSEATVSVSPEILSRPLPN